MSTAYQATQHIRKTSIRMSYLQKMQPNYMGDLLQEKLFFIKGGRIYKNRKGQSYVPVTTLLILLSWMNKPKYFARSNDDCTSLYAALLLSTISETGLSLRQLTH